MVFSPNVGEQILKNKYCLPLLVQFCIYRVQRFGVSMHRTGEIMNALKKPLLYRVLLRLT
jgi:hypothetical protein